MNKKIKSKKKYKLFIKRHYEDTCDYAIDLFLKECE
jgi:hypothetical protein